MTGMSSKLRKLLAGGIVAAGATAAANRLLASQVRELAPPLGRATDLYRWRGFDVAYTEAGDPDDPDLLLVHGVNAVGSSAEFSRVVDALAADYHVLAPDLPGFGLSDRPPLVYSASLYTTFVREFVRDLTEDPVVVASGLSGAYAATVAAESEREDGDDGRTSELVLVCPRAETASGRRTWLRSLVRSPLAGEALFDLLASRPAIRYFVADHGLYDASLADEAYVEYRWQLAHQPGARFAPASFLAGFLDPDVDLEETLAGLGVPVTIACGREGDDPSRDRLDGLAAAADARFVLFDEARLLPHYEHPDEFVDLVRGRLSAGARAGPGSG